VAIVEHLLKSQRSALIELLKARGPSSVEELARELEVSKVCVRRHLALLESDQLIEFEVAHGERGRPRHLYRLTEKAALLFPNANHEFAKEILVHLERAYGTEAVGAVLAERADEQIAQLSPRMEGLGFAQRVRRLLEAINEKGYAAEATRLGDGTYRLRQCNCPTEHIAADYPQICEQELRVYREALGGEVRRQCRIADGAPVCEYHLSPPARRSLRVLQ
jgi:predicted ArsR family transcriptional regulator